MKTKAIMAQLVPIATLWLALFTVASAQVSNSDQFVFLNHFFVVVDESTYRDIEDSDFLKHVLSVTETRVTRRNDASYSGYYMYGGSTYFEFLTKSLNPWESAIILSGDTEGAMERVKDSQIPQMDISSIPITREFEGQQVPWFFIAGNLGYPTRREFGVGIMEYHPHYLSKYYPMEEPRSGGVSRKDVLTRYASIMGESQAERILNDVVGITVSVTPSERTALLQLFRSIGFISVAEGDYDVLMGSDFELRITSIPNTMSRITEVRLSLDENYTENRTLRFGAESILRISEGEAVWSF